MANTTEKQEANYIAGQRAVYREMLGVALRGLGRDLPASDGLAARVAVLERERSEALAVLRRLCEEHGDTDWDDDLHLADVIDKHLGKAPARPGGVGRRVWRGLRQRISAGV